ncbi:hypothetical protein LguiA_025767 [Lonicera macranthoides]
MKKVALREAKVIARRSTSNSHFQPLDPDDFQWHQYEKDQDKREAEAAASEKTPEAAQSSSFSSSQWQVHLQDKKKREENAAMNQSNLLDFVYSESSENTIRAAPPHLCWTTRAGSPSGRISAMSDLALDIKSYQTSAESNLTPSINCDVPDLIPNGNHEVHDVTNLTLNGNRVGQSVPDLPY